MNKLIKDVTNVNRTQKEILTICISRNICSIEIMNKEGLIKVIDDKGLIEILDLNDYRNDNIDILNIRM